MQEARSTCLIELQKNNDFISAGPAITEIFKFITGSIIASGNAAKPVMTAAEIKGVKTVDEFILDSI